LRCVEKSKQRDWLQAGEDGFAVLLVDRNPARQCGGDTHVFIEHLLGLLWLANFKDQAFPGEIDTQFVRDALSRRLSCISQT
jgi:hypothetical protein